MSRGRGRSLDDEERVLWSTVTKSIDPLHKRSRTRDDLEGPVPGAAHRPVPVTPRPRASEHRPVKTPEPPPLASLDRRARKRLVKGRDSIDGRLDLHGMTQEEAHHALDRFLENALQRDARLLLVITGKGRGGNIGVLRRQVPLWLSLPEFRARIIGYDQAHIAHGGEGALYIRVRRRREITE
jgi:DNA-nicking Smr family endonuclease